MTQPGKLSNASPASDARAQAEAYDSMIANVDLALEGGGTISIPPHPDLGMLDDDRIDEYNELLLERDTQYERDPDIIVPEQEHNGVVHPSETIQGSLKIPYRWKTKGTDAHGQTHTPGQLVKPAWQVRVAQACLGEAEYKRLRDGGRSAADVWKIWGRKGVELRERQAADPKSAGSSMDLAPVPEADSQ